jgi:hypothetical protein
MGKNKHIGFHELAMKIAREYERKGYSRKTAWRWAIATAGKVRAEQLHKRRKK